MNDLMQAMGDIGRGFGYMPPDEFEQSPSAELFSLGRRSLFDAIGQHQ